MKQLSFSKVTVTVAATFLSLLSVYAQTNAKKVNIAGVPAASKPTDASITPVPPENMTTIYSTLGHVYAEYRSDGWQISGATAEDSEQFVGMPFTPAADATIYVIAAALGYGSGTNAASYAVYNDAGGLPGTAMQTFNVSNLYTDEGYCCSTRVVVSTSGIPVKAGTQYWIVLSAAPSAENFEGIWEDNYQEEVGPFAGNQGSGWRIDRGPISAFGVYGVLAAQ